MKVKILDKDATAPEKKSSQAAGYDIYSGQNNFVESHSRKLISTGFSIEIPEGYYGRIAPRSSLAVKSIDVGAGVVDSDYRGEVKVLLINNSNDTFFIKTKDRIAQLIITKIDSPEIKVEKELTDTERGEGGFGSTGK